MEWGDCMSKSTFKKKRVEIITVCICAVLIAAILVILIMFNNSKEFIYNITRIFIPLLYTIINSL